MPSGLNPFSSEVSVQAEAQAVGGSPLCLLGLSSSMANTVQIDGSSVVANGCGVSSNSSAPNGLVVSNGGSIAALVVCSSGGLQAGGGATSPPGKTDCPRTADPLASRDGPRRERCDFRDMVVRGRRSPRAGCLLPRADHRRRRQGQAAAGRFRHQGRPVGHEGQRQPGGHRGRLLSDGSRAVLDIAAETIVSLSAPVTGPLAGMLFYEDRSNAPPSTRWPAITRRSCWEPSISRRAGSRSAPPYPWTLSTPCTQSRSPRFRLDHRGRPAGQGDGGLGLVLNTDYSQTDVPVPDGAGGGEVSLVR